MPRRESDPENFDPSELRHNRHDRLETIFKVNIGLVITMVAYFGTGVWWASAQTSELKYLRSDLTRIDNRIEQATADRYTSNDASRDITAIQKQIQANTLAIQNNTSAIQRFYERAFGRQ